MKDSSELLNFNPNRQLQFSVFRPVEFPSHRDLNFDLNRSLHFDSKRVLPFGKKGVDFRRFVCGGCGVVVEGGAEICPGCKAVFMSKEEPIESTTTVKLSKDITHSKMKDYFGEEYKEKRKPSTRTAPIYHCGACGNNLRYIPQSGKWYCNRCKIYLRTSRKGSPKKARTYTQQTGYRPTGTKFVGGQNIKWRQSSDVVVVEALNKKRRGR